MFDETELLLRIFSDPLPERAEAAYLFAQTEPNQASVFAAGRDLLEQGRAERLWISDCLPKSGYVGAAATRRAMASAGIPADAIEEVPMEPTEILHTRIESERVVALARRRDYARLIVVSSPFHQERAFMTMATVAMRDYPALKLYSRPGVPQRWDETVTHSQGTLTGTRADLIASERRRIATYTAKGDLADRAEVLHYVRTRD